MVHNQSWPDFLKGRWFGPAPSFTHGLSFSIDTRTMLEQSVYIALKGPNFDGHNFVNQAFERGASAAIVDRPCSELGPCLVVKDTGQALLSLSSFYRQRERLPMVAITGSCGKTTIRMMIETILSNSHRVLSSQASYNNRVGVPLTLLRLAQQSFDCIVQEMGANHHGEIQEMVNATTPDSVMISNAAPCHLEGFGDLDGVSRAKSEILGAKALKESHAFAILPFDDPYFEFWKSRACGRRVVSFGFNAGADYQGSQMLIKDNCLSFYVIHKGQRVPMVLPLLGKHNGLNALASIALTHQWGVPLTAIAQALLSVKPEHQRLQVYQGKSGSIVIDDSFNANPSSMREAIDVLAERSGRRILVAGDMLELGDDALEYHRTIAAYAKACGIDALYCFGELSAVMPEAFSLAKHFSSRKSLIEAVLPEIDNQVTILVKGSKSMKMHEVVDAIKLEEI